MSIEQLSIHFVKSYSEFRLEADLALFSGEFFALVGPSGCGKTTLLRLIAGLEKPDPGSSLCLNGADILAMPPAKRGIGMVFQDYALFPHFTVAQNIAYALKYQKLRTDERGRRLAQILSLLELTGYESRNVNLLSGGERQRVALARALVAQPSVLLLDEPFAALDYTLRQRLREELRQLQRRLGLTMIFVTHQQEEALELADRLAVMETGRISQCGTPREVYESPRNLFTAKFLGDANLISCRIFGSTASGWRGRLPSGEICPLTARDFEPGDYWMMIRPEDIKLEFTAEWGLSRRIVARRYFGSNLVLEIVGEFDRYKVIADKNFPAAEGDPVRIGWEPTSVRFFKRESRGSDTPESFTDDLRSIGDGNEGLRVEATDKFA
jgi:ABC-type Fe3+/spermidine/putrescine transport system ATPase subunit